MEKEHAGEVADARETSLLDGAAFIDRSTLVPCRPVFLDLRDPRVQAHEASYCGLGSSGPAQSAEYSRGLGYTSLSGDPAPGEADVASEPVGACLDQEQGVVMLGSSGGTTIRTRKPSPMADLRPKAQAETQPTSPKLALKRLGTASPRT
eukprot:5787192-Amphidinium_carterae.1